MYALLTGIGQALPENIVTNDDLARTFDTSDEWIVQRTGISQRRHSRSESTSDLAVRAARAALHKADRDRVDVVILATTTPDYPCPGTAPAVATGLGMTDVPAFDISAVCSGFVYALSVGSSLIESGRFASVLVIGAEIFSTILDPTDRTTAAIFGDGAGAVVLERTHELQPGVVGKSILGSDGSKADLIRIPGGGSAAALSGVPASPFFQMQGTAVFLDAVTRMEEAVRAVVSAQGWALGDLDALVPHQANARIIAALAKKLGLDSAVAVTNIAEVGNTSAASIPLALAQAEREERLRAGDRMVLAAYGGGTTWGAVALTWPQLSTEEPESTNND